MQNTAATQDRVFLSPPHMSGGELALVKEAFDSNYIAPLGPMVDQFEKEFSEYIGIPHCVAVSAGTSAMHLAMRELNVQPGDEVIASSLTFIGSVSAATFQGASLVFIDAERDSWNMDPDLLAAELSACAKRGVLPKVVVPTDLYGQCVDIDRILAICEPYQIPVITDSAESLGATYKGRHAGRGSTASIYSFNGNKIITSSGGGMLASTNKDLIDHARFLATQAKDPKPYYEHSEVGYNYRMSNVVAAIGLGQLRVLDERVCRKRELFEAYKERLALLRGFSFMPEMDFGQCNRWLTVVLIDSEEFGATPEEIRLALEAENIESRPIWKPMHLQPVFKNNRVRGGAVSEDLFNKGLCLPSGTAMTEQDLDRTCEIIQNCMK